MKFNTIYALVNQLYKIREDIQDTLRELRGNNRDWRQGIERDERPTIRHLYKYLQQLENATQMLRDIEIEMDDADIQMVERFRKSFKDDISE